MRIGDLVDHAGIIANVPIFRAPDLGSTGTVPAEAVVEAVRAPRAGRARHRRRRRSDGDAREPRHSAAKTIEDRVAQALAAQYALGPAKDIMVQFRPRAARDPGRAQPPRASRASPHINYDSRSGRFDVTLDMPTGAGSARHAAI